MKKLISALGLTMFLFSTSYALAGDEGMKDGDKGGDTMKKAKGKKMKKGDMDSGDMKKDDMKKGDMDKK